jgi:hypothetical protein
MYAIQASSLYLQSKLMDMKKQLFLFAAFSVMLFFSTESFAQEKKKTEAPTQKAFGRGDVLLSFGLSPGVIRASNSAFWAGSLGRRGTFMPFIANLEYGIRPTVSVGPYIGYHSYGYRWPTYNYNYNFFAFGLRGTWHAVPLINEEMDITIDENRFDIYATLHLGFELATFRTNDPAIPIAPSSLYPILGPVLGVRYMFTNKIGAFAEVGRGALGFSTIGITVKP